VLQVGVGLWSLGTLLAPAAAHLGLPALCASRVLVGLGEGFAPSAATSVLARQVPSAERSRAVSTVWGGLDVGSVAGLLIAGPLIRAAGWPSVFYLFAALGGVWCLAWPAFRPEEEDPAVKVGAGKDNLCARLCVHVCVPEGGQKCSHVSDVCMCERACMCA
jgi:ACS family sodium-dependent inorganic phosphate cotransporter